MKKRLILLLSLFVGACTTPERTLTISTWDTSHTTQTLVMAHEVGLQLWYGERHDVLSAGDVRVGSDISKGTIGALGSAAIGVAGGYLIGGAPGAVVGGAGGAIAGVLSQSKATTATTPLASTAVLSAAPISRAAAAPSPLAAYQVPGALDPATAQAAMPSITEALKSYIIAHPDQCQLVKTIGLKNVLALIDGQARAGQ